MKTLFDGETSTATDAPRLKSQIERVFDVMQRHNWASPEQLEALTGYRWASISARLRDFRKPKFGSHTVNRKNCGNGEFVYQLVPNGELRVVHEPATRVSQMTMRLRA